jgi:hypothetical protein
MRIKVVYRVNASVINEGTLPIKSVLADTQIKSRRKENP